MAGGKHHPHWRVLHAIRVHLWGPRDACVVLSVHSTRASLCCEDGCVATVSGAWVGWLCASHPLSSTLRRLDVAMADQSVLWRPGHHQLEHAGDTRVVPKLERVHLFGKRCVRRRGHVLL